MGYENEKIYEIQIAWKYTQQENPALFEDMKMSKVLDLL